MSYTIEQEKLEEVTRIFNQQVDEQPTEEVIEATICGDWNEGKEHQQWIQDALVQEIVDWLASFYN